MEKQWTRARLVGLIAQQLGFLQRNRREVAWEGGKGIWFGLPWADKQPHWARAHGESLHIVATYVAGVRAGDIEGAAPDLAPLLADLEAGVRAMCASHCSDGRLKFEHTRGPWGKGWQSALWAFRLLRTAMLMGDSLPADLKASVRRVMEIECDRFIDVTPPTGVMYDTKAEENGWDAPVLAWSSFAYPDHPHAKAWEKAARLWAMNALTVAADKFDRRPFEDGLPKSDWVAGACLHPDFTCENHGTFHPNYQATVMLNCLSASAYLAHGKEVPPQMLHNLRETAEVFGYFAAKDTTQLMVTGNDWATFHGLHSCLPLIAHFTGDPRWLELAEANLTRYEEMLSQSDTGHIFGSTMRANKGEQAFFFHTCNSTVLADVFPVLPLKAQGKAPVGFGGTRNWNYVEVVTQRDDLRLASMAWRTLYGHPLATILPVGGAGTSLAGWAPFTGVGRFVLADGGKLAAKVISHEEKMSAGGFVSAGTIEWRDAKGDLLIRQELEMQARAGEPVLLKEKSIAVAALDLAANEQWCMSVANDLHNKLVRKIKDQRGKVHSVRAMMGKESTLWAGFQVIVDDLIRYEADREIAYFSPGKRLLSDNRFECTQFDRVIVRAGIGKFDPGEVVRTGVLRIEAF